MLEPGGDPDLAQEALVPQLRRQIGAEHLHRHFAMVLGVFGEKDGGHAAGAQLSHHLVARRQGITENRSCHGRIRQGELQLVESLQHVPRRSGEERFRSSVGGQQGFYLTGEVRVPRSQLEQKPRPGGRLSIQCIPKQILDPIELLRTHGWCPR